MKTGSIRARLLLLLGAIFLVVLLGATLGAIDRREADTRQMHERLRAQARYVAEQQGDAVRRTERFLDFMAAAVAPSSLVGASDCPAKLQAYTRHDDYLANVFIADARGRVVCNPLGQSVPADIGDRSYFQQALLSPGVVVGAPLFGRFSGRWVLPMARRHGTQAGTTGAVVVAALDLGWVNRAFAQVAGAPGMRLGLVTSSGLVLARQPDPDRWVGTNISRLPAFAQLRALDGDGTAEVVSHDGQGRVYAFAPFVRTDSERIYLWMSLPTAVATAEADRQFSVQVGLTSGLLGLTFVLAWLGAHRWLVRPIEAIAGAARRLARGEAGARTGAAHGSDEMGQLAMAFDDMATQLGRLDTVTGLMNLGAFRTALDALLAGPRPGGGRLAVLRMQIRNVQMIEAQYGLATCIEVVRAVGLVLQRAQGGLGPLARAGDGSFALTRTDEIELASLGRLVERLRGELTQPLRMPGGETPELEVCFGVAFHPEDGRSATALLQHAGLALAQAQADPALLLCCYEAAMNERLSRRSRRLAALREAVRDGAFELHYQPQVELGSGRLLGFEALVRWQHPVEGWIPPAEFIPLAEESGLIVALGDWILQRALTQLADWRRARPGLEGLVMAVNISALQLRTADFCERVARALEGAGLPPQALELEITESQLMTFSNEPLRLIAQLKAMGLLLSIDDFGTGYSSLAYLKHFSADRLKIDKTFVDRLGSDADDEAIVEATIAMAHKLGMTVIAEGVETAQQASVLRALGCDQMQGYLISRPLAAAAALDFTA